MEADRSDGGEKPMSHEALITDALIAAVGVEMAIVLALVLKKISEVIKRQEEFKKTLK
jgi:hypothetical protein